MTSSLLVMTSISSSWPVYRVFWQVVRMWWPVFWMSWPVLVIKLLTSHGHGLVMTNWSYHLQDPWIFELDVGCGFWIYWMFEFEFWVWVATSTSKTQYFLGSGLCHFNIFAPNWLNLSFNKILLIFCCLFSTT